MKVLIDTNVLLNYIIVENHLMRKLQKLSSYVQKKKQGFMAAHSIPNMMYILRKDLPEEARRIVVKNLFNILAVEGIDRMKLLSALNNMSILDFEDALQEECAISSISDYIITRNIKDFANSRIKAVTPKEFLSIYQNLTN